MNAIKEDKGLQRRGATDKDEKTFGKKARERERERPRAMLDPANRRPAGANVSGVYSARLKRTATRRPA